MKILEILVDRTHLLKKKFNHVFVFLKIIVLIKFDNKNYVTELNCVIGNLLITILTMYLIYWQILYLDVRKEK